MTRAEAMQLSTFVVSLTPFTEKGELDEDALRGHLRRMREARMGVYLGGSGTGEGLTLSPAETLRLYQIGREELKGHVPVRAMGIEPRTVAEMVALSELAREAGLDAMQVYSVLAPGAKQAELEDYFAAAVGAIKMPCVISIHHAHGYTVSPEVVAHVVDGFPNVIGVNCTHADIRLLDLVGKKVAVQTAAAGDFYANVSLGGHGFLSNVANLVPKLCVSVIDAFKAGDYKRAAEQYAAVLRVEYYNSTHLGTKGLKAALGILGLPAGHPRKPRLPLTTDELAKVKTAVEALRALDLDDLKSRV